LESLTTLRQKSVTHDTINSPRLQAEAAVELIRKSKRTDDSPPSQPISLLTCSHSAANKYKHINKTHPFTWHLLQTLTPLGINLRLFLC